MPDVLDPWLSAMVGRPGWDHYAAWDGEQLVATGAVFVAERTAWFGFAATLEGHRSQGAQSALITRRFAAALARGCDWVVTETAEQTTERLAPSYKNLQRLGFTEAYRRDNYVVTLPVRG
jgi:GNAT superfamily N-acetyltransferase